MRIITFRITPKNYYDKTFRFYEKSFHGSSFLVNAEDLLQEGRAYSDKEVAEYVGVASFRNYYEYKKTKDTTLDLIFCQVSENTINKTDCSRLEMERFISNTRRHYKENIMAIGFNTTKGSAQKSKIETYNFGNKEDHHIRLVGDLLPRYVYWIKGENNKNIPMECLSFDRNSETFNNVEHDHVRDFYLT